MAQPNPISQAVLAGLALVAKENNATTNLEKVRAEKAQWGRDAVPQVFAQLQEQAEKRAAKAKKIQEQGGREAPQVAPPMVPVDGQARSGGGQAIFNALADSVGREGSSGLPDPQGGGPQPAAGGTQVGAPGSVVPVQRDLPGWERGLRGVAAVIGARSGGLGGLIPAISGKETIGYDRQPTVSQIGDSLAETFYLARQGADGAANALNEQLSQVVQQFGPEVGQRAAQRGLLGALTKEQKAREAAKLKAEDPNVQRSRRINELQARVADKGIEDLNPGERLIFEGAKRSTTVNISNAFDLTTATQSKLEQASVANQELFGQLDNIDAVFQDEYLQRGAGAKKAFLGEKARFGVTSAEDNAWLNGYAKWEQASSALTAEKIHSMAGSAMTPNEIELILPSLPSKDDNPVAYKAKLGALRETLGLANLRYSVLLSKGVEEPRYGKSLAQTKEMALQMGAEREQQYVNHGMDPQAAIQAVGKEFKAQFGIDYNHLWQQSP